MTPEFHRRATGIFLEAGDRAAEERAVWIDQACGDDHTLGTEVESLLGFHQPGECGRGEAQWIAGLEADAEDPVDPLPVVDPVSM